MATHSSILAWKFHGQRSLVAYSPWGYTESDTIEHTHKSQYILVIKSSFCFLFFNIDLGLLKVQEARSVILPLPLNYSE